MRVSPHWQHIALLTVHRGTGGLAVVMQVWSVLSRVSCSSCLTHPGKATPLIFCWQLLVVIRLRVLPDTVQWSLFDGEVYAFVNEGLSARCLVGPLVSC